MYICVCMYVCVSYIVDTNQETRVLKYVTPIRNEMTILINV